MFIRKIENNMRKTFVFILRRPDGSEYEVNTSAINETEAKRRIENLLEISYSLDEFVGLKQPNNGE
jgi:hypothetical protein